MDQFSVTSPYNPPCMECHRPGMVRPVLLGFKKGVEVVTRGTGELVGYLHVDCKDAWLTKNDEGKFSFRDV
jgi:hypothetical protein